MKRVVVLALLLAGCASSPVKTETVAVKIPVAVQPIKPEQVPALPAPLPKRPANASAALDLALAQVCHFVAYALKADPLLRLSAGMPAKPVPTYPECEKR